MVLVLDRKTKKSKSVTIYSEQRLETISRKIFDNLKSCHGREGIIITSPSLLYEMHKEVRENGR